ERLYPGLFQGALCSAGSRIGQCGSGAIARQRARTWPFASPGDPIRARAGAPSRVAAQRGSARRQRDALNVLALVEEKGVLEASASVRPRIGDELPLGGFLIEQRSSFGAPVAIALR